MPSRLVAHFDLLSEFLDYLLRSDASAVTAIICSSKQTFIQDFCSCIQMQSVSQQCGGPHEEGGASASSLPIELLSDTMGTIAMSKKVALAFCSSVEHLRAKLSLFHVPPEQVKGSQECNNTQRSSPLLAIFDPLAVHARCSEFSAQGLSRSLALAVEVAAAEDMDIVLCERPAAGFERSEHDGNPWNVDIPLLNPSGGVALGQGIGGTRRTVTPRHIAKRWFEFKGGTR